MQRRHVLLGVGAAASGSALIGTGAFSRVESHRDVTIEVAEDPDAYLGMSGTGSTNSDNYVSIDDNGHLAIDISDSGNDGHGVNSDSYTWFDSMVQVCNQGKEGAGFYIQELEDDDLENVDATDDDGEPRLQFYTGEAAGEGESGTSSVMGDDNAVDIPVGECIELGLRTNTKGVDASDGSGVGQLISDDDEVTLIADVDVEQDLGDRDQPIRNSRSGAGYDSIQSAINDAEDGDTIEVLTGTEFEEDVSIDVEGLTLEATSNSKPKIIGGVEVDADDVTLSELEIEGTGDINADASTVYINSSYSGFTLTDSTVITQDVGQGDGLVFASGGHSNALIESNTFEAPAEDESSTNPRRHVYVNGPSDAVDVVDNTFTGDGLAGGLPLGHNADESEISENTFDVGTDFGQLEVTGEDVDVNDNTFEGDELGDEAFYVSGENLDLDAVLNDQNNEFDPEGAVEDDQIVPQ